KRNIFGAQTTLRLRGATLAARVMVSIAGEGVTRIRAWRLASAALCALTAASCDACTTGAGPTTADARGHGSSAPAVARDRPVGWLKGQLHLHSNRSGDSDTPPERAASWYAEHGFDFIVFTDHNHVTRVEGPSGLLVLPGVELTQNLRSCEPPPAPG